MHAVVVLDPARQLVDDRLGVGPRVHADVVALERASVLRSNVKVGDASAARTEAGPSPPSMVTSRVRISFKIWLVSSIDNEAAMQL